MSHASIRPGFVLLTASLSNYYTLEYGLIGRDDESRSAYAASLVHTLRQRGASLLRFEPLDDAQVAVLEAALRSAGMNVERYPAFGNWIELARGRCFDDFFAERPSQQEHISSA